MVSEPVEGGERTAVRCRIFLDVDGVLNAVTKKPDPSQWPEWRDAECMGFTIRYAPEVGRRLGALAALPGVELRWLTTWEHDANEWIAPLFDWPKALVMERHDIEAHRSGLLVATSGWWKFDEVKALHEEDPVPFVWIDDDLGFADCGATDWLRTLDKGTWCGIRTVGHKGLTDRLLTEVERFVATATAAASQSPPGGTR